MELKDAYVIISKRSLLVAEAALAAEIYEATGFYAYHAFESIGGALCATVGEDYSLGHIKKIHQFLAVSNRGRLRHQIGHEVSVIATLLADRNELLYPQQVEDKVILPNQVLSRAEAKDLLKRVKGICQRVEKLV